MANKTESEMTSESPPKDAEPHGLGGDSFYHGTIQRLHPRNNNGVIRTSSGREIPFSYQLVDLFGPVKKPQELREGLVVGYDMSWTSHGLRVTKIKTYRRVGEEPGRPDAEKHEPADGIRSRDGKGE